MPGGLVQGPILRVKGTDLGVIRDKTRGIDGCSGARQIVHRPAGIFKGLVCYFEQKTLLWVLDSMSTSDMSLLYELMMMTRLGLTCRIGLTLRHRKERRIKAGHIVL
jgi:hypothetical protein